MSEASGTTKRYESLRASRWSIGVLAPVVQIGLLAVGLALFLERAGVLVSDMQLTWGERRIVGAVALMTLGGFGVGAWVAGRLLRTLAELIDAVADQAEAATRTADLLERHVVPTLARMAVSLERPAAPVVAAADGSRLGIEGIRKAIDEARWDRAERLVEAFRRDYPEAPEADDLAAELADARQRAVDDLRARLDAARSANDAEQAIGFRDELTRHLRGEPLRDLDRDLIRWLMNLIQRKLRAGSMQKSAAELAARVVDSFGDTPEGASLRAALPTLRRSAGLCARCSRPYTGIEDACPECLKPSVGFIPPAPPEPPSVERNGQGSGEVGP